VVSPWLITGLPMCNKISTILMAVQPCSERFCSLALGIFLFVIALPIVGSCLAQGGPGGGGLVAYWKFEEGAGNAVKDSSGNGNDGTIIPANAPEPKWGTGEFTGSVSLSGCNDHHVRIPSSESLNKLKGQITVVANIYPRILWTPPSTDYISVAQRKWRKAVHLAEKLLGITTNSECSPSTAWTSVVQRQWRETRHPDLFYLGYGAENNVLHYKWHLGLIGAEVSLYRLPEGQDKPRVGEWVHLAGTYNGQTGEMSLYVNGKLIGTETHVGEIRLDPESLNRPLVIGAELNGSNIDDVDGEFNGYVDEVRIYDRALSDEEIKILAEEARRRVAK
jgi:Concanavalin A-like lectin/glucanases superfamily